MAKPPGVDDAGRVIAGLLGYNPGPGIYSRLERAIQAMPENVRVEELPGLLKRYKEGVPGWELKATDLDSAIAGRPIVPREDLLSAVRERSPVYTHGEIVLGGTPPMFKDVPHNVIGDAPDRYVAMDSPEYQLIPSRPGEGVSHGDPKYEDYGQGGGTYSELLLVQPNSPGQQYGNHWGGAWTQSDHVSQAAQDRAVAHARYDTHGDALRINELQSDLGIHNRKMREQAQESRRLLEERGVPVGSLGMDTTLPFPLEDTWSDLLIKRLALEAARQGHRAIEIASPRAIADKVGGNIENYEHFYGKVIPGALERLGRKMGGLTEDDGMIAVPYVAERPSSVGKAEVKETIRSMPTSAGEEFAGAPFWKNYSEMMHANLSPLDSDRVYQEFGGYGNYGRSQEMAASDMYERLRTLGYSTQEAQAITSRALFEAPRAAAIQANYANEQALGRKPPAPSGVGRRYIMSDEMRRRILTQGIGASVLAPLVTQEER